MDGGGAANRLTKLTIQHYRIIDTGGCVTCMVL